MKGCPTLEEIQRCEPYADVSWCYTKDDSCAQQSDAQLGGGWANCDPVSGRVYAIGEAQEDIGGIIATSVALTFLVMAVVVAIAFVSYPKYAIAHRETYSEIGMAKLTGVREDSMQDNDL